MPLTGRLLFGSIQNLVLFSAGAITGSRNPVLHFCRSYLIRKEQKHLEKQARVAFQEVGRVLMDGNLWYHNPGVEQCLPL